ncbi:unnamed protein product [Rotaria sp. Silwood1]|nr:unnamed protein product [Rotaria sp. Silwood1]CAF3337831.1 unnamed protein product [Rotaria sp. Silwood1]CAF3342352.1 unnamed protein product [Rotaria sp. Silwood1]CAF4625165.1 unnamed protein product [Rotaria sp. Silwood1]CAF4940113.1 unnamed protein product [Rotaria sp. Silwood1]
MAANKGHIHIEETLHEKAGQISEVEYIYKESFNSGNERNYTISVKRADYERLAATIGKPTLPFDKFAKVLKPFMMGAYAAADVPEAFRLLDADHSGTIDIGELAAFMPVIIPDGNPYMLLHHIEKVDKNNDYKLNLAEFTDFVNKGIGRDFALGRL